MKIRHLRIRITTSEGVFGADLRFSAGLNILQASNSMGKSTCIKSIIVALGLEATLTTNQRDLPLPPVMTSELNYENRTLAVLESEIFLEVDANGKDPIVLHRTVKGLRDSGIISVVDGPALTEPVKSSTSRDYFVSRPGSATRQAGFHKFLEEYLNYDLPHLPAYNGKDQLLYLQYIFPYFIVEQTRGWSHLQPPIPRHFGLQEPHKRAVEFILDLDAMKVSKKRMKILEKRKELLSLWREAVKVIETIADSVDGTAHVLPKCPISSWPPEIEPSILVYADDVRIPLEIYLTISSEQLRILTEEELPLIKNLSNELNQQLSTTQRSLAHKDALLARLLDEQENENSGATSIRNHLQSIEVDLQRNKDIQTLISMGSDIARNTINDTCPTCLQKTANTLVPAGERQDTLSIASSIDFIEQQKVTIKSYLSSIERSIETRSARIKGLQSLLSEDRSKVRAIKQSLVSSGELPSIEALNARVRLQARIEQLEKAYEGFETTLVEFERLTVQWKEILTEESTLPRENLTESDNEKINKWTAIFQEQLGEFGFKSLTPISDLQISPESYHPLHKGFDLPSSVSASDFVRVIWAYLLGMLELSRLYMFNHPGFVVFDEPRQQSTDKISFEDLLRRASLTKGYDQQVIFATSEDEENLRLYLTDVDATLHSFKSHIIGRVEQ